MAHGLPTEQQRIRAKCVHPSGSFTEFEKAAVERSISERFEEMVARYPDRIAIKTTTHALTYDELNQKANRVARAILSRGANTEAIALLMEDRCCMLTAILGVLKAGKIYVPIDPSYPTPYMAFMLKDSNARLILSDNNNVALVDSLGERGCDGVNIERLGRTLAVNNIGLSIAPQAIAYIMYTSGSTGQPKGVVQNHRNVLHKIMDATNTFHFCVDDRLSLLYSCSFSASVLPIFSALLNGAVLCPFNVQKEGTAGLANWLSQEAVTAYLSGPTLFRYFVDTLSGEQLRSIRFVYLSGESLTRKDMELFRKHFPAHCVLVHTLAMGETGTARQFFMDKGTEIEGSVVPVGYEVPDKEVLLLDERGEEAGFEEIGEIVIRSPYLAVGYWQRPDLTEATFESDPEKLDGRTYRTGDLGRMRPDGCLYHLGRKDLQVKTRGFKIDVSDAETALMNLGAIKEAVVLAKPDAAGDTRLVAYIVPSGQPPTVSALRRTLRGQLPPYMVPSAFVVLDAMPLTPTGKIDRRALPDPQNVRPQLDIPFVSPRTPVETQLARIWAEVLGLDQVGAHDNFFDLGGHSLTAAQIVSRVIRDFQLELPLTALFQAPTVAEMALVILEDEATKLGPHDLDRILSELDALSEEEARRVLARAVGNRMERLSKLSPTKRALLEVKLGQAPGEQTIPRGAGRPSAPPSLAQQRLWFLHQLEPDNPSYNQPRAVRVRGLLDVASLENALTQIVMRHEVLRTTFTAVEGAPVQVIHASAAVDVALEDLRYGAESTRAAQVQRLMEAVIRRPFDLSRDVMVRALVLRLADDEHVVVLVTHHIASDAWSSDILWDELATLYEGLTLQPLPIQYVDYAVWQRDRLQGGNLDAHMAYWKRQLAAVPANLDLPIHEPRPAVQSYWGAQESIVLVPELTERLKAFSRGEGMTLFMTLLAAFQTLLHRYSAQDDIVVGSPTAGRTRVETEGLIGFFVNTLALRTDLSGNPPFPELLRRVCDVVLAAQTHQEVPFERLVEELQPERSLSRSPLFQVMFVLQTEHRQIRSFAGLSVTPVPVHSGTAKFDLFLSMREEDGRLTATLEYNSDLFDAGTITRMLGHFCVLLNGIVTDPERRLSDLPLLTDAERRRVLLEWNDTNRNYPPDQCIHQLVETQAKRTPGAVAVIYGNQRLTYRQLNARANQLAHYLSKRGVGPDVRVGLCVRRSLDMAVALLGILKAGGAYVPLDPNYPKDRLTFMIEDAQLPVVVVHEDLRARLGTHPAQQVLLDANWKTIAQESREAPATDVTPRCAVYVLYTSGSTGRPKGVVMEHHALVNLIRWQIDSLPVPVEARTLQFAPQSFDVAFQEALTTWCSGGTLILVSDDVRQDAAALLRMLVTDRVERVFLPFVALQQLAQAAEATTLVPRSLRQIITAGEQLHVTPAIAAFIKRLRDCRLYNQYGPTETHVVTVFTVSDSARGRRALPPIGRPIANTRVYILDAHLQPVPIGVMGELYVGGVALARGYLDRSELTQAKFIPDPFSNVAGARLYKTGDRARYLEDGNIEFFGRLDSQVKFRGFRIELGEIESLLRQHPAVRDVAVVLRNDAHSEKRLTAYVVPSKGSDSLVGDLHDVLKTKLPDYMIPSAFVVLEHLPLTPSGKVDRAALPALGTTRPHTQHALVAPRTAIEAELADVWSRVLGIDPIGVRDNFFDLGGHSLLVTKLVAQIERRLGVGLPVRSLFECPTIELLAAHIDNGTRPHSQRHQAATQSYWISLQTGLGDRAVFCVPYIGGFRADLARFSQLGRLVGPDYFFYGLQARGTTGVPRAHRRLSVMLTEYIRAMKSIQPRGPYFLLGECFSGRLAYAIAQELRAQGEEVAFLGLLDVRNPEESLRRYLWRRLTARVRYRYDRISDAGGWAYVRARAAFHLSELTRSDHRLRYGLALIASILRVLGRGAPSWNSASGAATDGHGPQGESSKALANAERFYWLALNRYRRRPYAGHITVFVNEEWYKADPTLGWTNFAMGGLEVQKIPGSHLTCVTDYIHVLGTELRKCLDKAVVETRR